MPIRGSCHCGKIAFTLDEVPTEAITCNCSICSRKGSVLTAAAPDKFTLDASPDDIVTYTFKTHNISHQSCKTCSCTPFAKGKGPGGRDMVMINLRCADDFDLSTLKITEFDGASL